MKYEERKELINEILARNDHIEDYSEFRKAIFADFVKAGITELKMSESFHINLYRTFVEGNPKRK